jgi:type I restriction enzyme S subunit
MGEMQENTAWAKVKLGDLVEIVMGQAPPGTQCNKLGAGTVFVKAGEFGGLRPVVREWTTQPLKFARAADVLICVVGATAGKINLGLDCAIGRSVAAIRPCELLNQLYLYYFLSTKILSLRGDSVGSAQGVISKDDLALIDFSLPSLSEQHRIVAKIEELFSELDQGVASLKTAREQLKVYRQSLLKSAFAGKLTAAWRATHRDQLETATALQQRIARERQARYQQQFADWQIAGQSGPKPKPPKPLPPLTAEELAELPELPSGWGWVKLGELTWSVKDGPHFSPKYSESGVPFISGGNVRPEGIDFTKAKFISPELHEELSKRCRPDRGDLLYTKGGTTGIARVNTYDVDFNVWVHVAVLKLTEAVLPFYVQHALNSSFCYSQAQKYTHGVGNQDLGLTRMVNIVLAACSLSEQEEVIQIVDDKMSVIDQLDQTLATALQQADALRQSILKKAFSGQLVAQDESDEPATALLECIRARHSSKQPARRGRSARSQS